MLNILRSQRAQPSIPVYLSTFPYKACGIRFQQAVSGNNFPEKSGKMDQSQGKKPREENIASFGEGYATRSDEEGFGGVYGENQQLSKRDEEKIVHAKVSEFDASQGSEVKEKEKARHQKEA
ncbi:hypothetical protein ACH5RR_031274 [Cinchona calisaya]|uniref:Uncharacterized protein n=1 Tax=Cinchona calisaya TaxID=153742 RepID=A0ABD2YJ49_9GENT